MNSPPAPTPPALADALARELDPGEPVLWSGMPSPRRYARRDILVVLLLVCFGGCFAGMLTVGSYRTVVELQTLSAPPPLASLVVARFGLIVGSLALILILLMPFIYWRSMLGRARSTVYAITPTRVLELRLARGGVARVKSLEPSHPLDITRRDFPNGEGNLMLYPLVGNPSQCKLTLVGITSPREVDRVLRGAFNPK